MNIIQFILGDLWHFVGAVILLGIVCETIIRTAVALRSGRFE